MQVVPLSTEHEQLFERTRSAIAQFAQLVERARTLDPQFNPDLDAIQQQLQNPFSIFVCGEFNAGKSSILNQLGSQKLAAVGILPTTSQIEAYQPEGFNGIVFIDSPGTNSIIEQHQAITESYLQRADIILFVTSVERPLAKSEQDFLELVNQTWRRKVIVVVNKADLVSESELETVKSYIGEGLHEVFNLVPPIYAVSGKTGEGIQHLRQSLLDLLAETERIKLKLAGPGQSLLVYIHQLQEQNQQQEKTLLEQKAILDRTLQRIQNRVEQYDLIFDVFAAKIDELFDSLLEGLEEIIEDNFVFVNLIKKRLLPKEDLLEARITQVISRVQLQQRTEEIVKDAATNLLQYRNRVLKEAQEDLEIAAELSGSMTVPALSTNNVDVTELAQKVKVAAETGLTRFLTLGTAAAATGIGGHILATAALFDLSAFALALMLGVFSINAVPQQKEKAKQQIKLTFRELEKSYIDTLKQTLTDELATAVKQFDESLQPQIDSLQSQIEVRKEIETQAEALQQEINTLLEEINSLS